MFETPTVSDYVRPKKAEDNLWFLTIGNQSLDINYFACWCAELYTFLTILMLTLA